MSLHHSRLVQLERLARQTGVSLVLAAPVRHACRDYDPPGRAWGCGGQWVAADWVEDDGPRGENGRVTVTGWNGADEWCYWVALHELGHAANGTVDEDEAWAWALAHADSAPDAIVEARIAALLAEYAVPA